jgi:hypothetical protein
VRELRSEHEKSFDLARGPVFRIRLLKCGEDDHVLLRAVHHIATDGWSETLFNRELSVLYDAFRTARVSPLSPLPVQYADFAEWQRSWLSSSLEISLEYWRKQLAGLPDELALPRDRPRHAGRTFEANFCERVISADLTAAIRRLGRSHGATLYMTLLASFALLLARYTGRDDVAVATPFAIRSDVRLVNLIGLFINTLVLRIRLSPRLPFSHLLRTVRQTTLDSYRHGDVPFERLVELHAPVRQLNLPPLVQVEFAVHNAPRAALQLAGVSVERVPSDARRVRKDLEVHVEEDERGLRTSWISSRALFEPWRIEQMARDFERVLATVVRDAGRPVGQMELLDATERAQLTE